MSKKVLGLLLALVISAVCVAPVLAATDPFGVGTVGSTLVLGSKDLKATAGSIINIALGFLGIVAVCIVLAGGFMYMTAGGDDTKAKKARQFIISGIIGLAIILCAYAITTYVIGSLVNNT
jgi:hypothetical protein